MEVAQDLPSDSDSSDEDYVPKGAENEGLSEEEDSGTESDEKRADIVKEKNTARKRRKKSAPKKSRKKSKPESEEKTNEEEGIDKAVLRKEEEEKKIADALWADFMKDCGPVGRKHCEAAPAADDQRVKGVSEEKENSKSEEPQPSKKKITQIFEFAGEKVEVETEVAADSKDEDCSVKDNSRRGRGIGRGRGSARGGIASILGQLGKKGKLSTLEKSKLDWDRFKKDEGIDEELELHNKGKNGYLEKQDFLQRTDLRQFELEKNMRTSRRSLNR